MDKRSILALGLIGVILISWMIYLSVTQKPEPAPPQQSADTVNKIKPDTQKKELPEQRVDSTATNIKADSLNGFNKFGPVFYPLTKGTEEIITVENELIVAKISSKGAALLEWTLKKFKMWNGYETQLLWSRGGELFLNFSTRDNYRIDTRNLYFKFDNTQSYYKISGRDSLILTAKIEPEPGRTIIRKYIFYGNTYHILTDVTLNNMETIIPVKGYKFEWADGLRYQEKSTVDESSDAEAMTSMNKELEYIDASGDEPVEKSASGKIDFAAIKTKYFTVGIIPYPLQSFDGTVVMSGNLQYIHDEGKVERYNLSFLNPYRGGVSTRTYKVYVGPLDYSLVSEYGLEATVSFGWRWIIRPIGEFFMLPIFKLIFYFVGNYGISIIIFSLLMKILLYPLSISQMKSAQRMQLLQPEMTKLREKYKDDQKQQQAEMMKLYSEYGINPAGGCLPLLLQMPILYALWAVLRAAIDLRQAPFILWITDLSLPDVLFTLPFSLLGIKFISGLALLMGITMFLQQKMTITDPRQKSLVYAMPIMFTLMFSNFPSGLNLYYFMFNLFSIAQQYYMNNFSKKKLTLADLRRMPKKEGWLQKRMREAQEIASSQGRSVPGQPYSDKNKPQRTQQQRKKKR